jgi:hypothetical protein
MKQRRLATRYIPKTSSILAETLVGNGAILVTFGEAQEERVSGDAMNDHVLFV